MLAGDGIIQALSQTGTAADFEHRGNRALLVLAEMTSMGSLAVGEYTKVSIASARKHRDFVIGFVSTRALTEVADEMADGDSGLENEDFIIFTTGVNRAAKGDKLGQQYQTPAQAVGRGADFLIAGRGIYAVDDPVESAKLYREEGWQAYLERVGAKK